MGARFPSNEYSHCHVCHLRVPQLGSSSILIMPLLCAAVGLSDKRTTGRLNNIFLFQQTSKGLEFGSSHQRACKCAHICCLFLWGTEHLVVWVCGRFRGMKIQKISKFASQSLKRQNGTVAKCFVYGGDGLWANNVTYLYLRLFTYKLIIMVLTFSGLTQLIPIKVLEQCLILPAPYPIS